MVYDNNGISTSMLTKDYNNGYRALDSLNISVQAGDIYGFLGPNGAGKTTQLDFFVVFYRLPQVLEK